MFNKPKKDTFKNRYKTLTFSDNISLTWWESFLYAIKSYICDWLKRDRKPDFSKDQFTFYYGKIHVGFEGCKSWSERSVERGLFKDWYNNSYENGD